jgi:hypothetical protein
MSELDKILLTAVVTVIGGVSVFTVGQVIAKFLIEPIYEQRKVVGAIAEALLLNAHHLAESGELAVQSGAELREVSHGFRQLAAELMTKTVAIPGYRFWGWLRFIRPLHQIISARGGLFGLSNTLHTPDWERKMKFAEQIAVALKVTDAVYVVQFPHDDIEE